MEYLLMVSGAFIVFGIVVIIHDKIVDHHENQYDNKSGRDS
jgi:hypothetical protein